MTGNYRQSPVVHSRNRLGLMVVEQRASKVAWVVMGSALLLLAATLVVANKAMAAASAIALETPLIDQGNERSLQRGAQAFVNHCMGCHSAGYQRYSRLAQDLGLSDEDVENNLIFTTDEAGEPTKVGALMTNNMTTEYGKQAFGVVPPIWH